MRGRRFSWDALKVTNDTACGHNKCYFQGDRADEGWLVGVGDASMVHLTQWSRAWAFAEELRADFGVGHLMRGAPFLANLTREQAKHLNARMHKVLEDTLRHNLELPWGQTRAAMRLPTITGDRNYYAAGLHPVQAVHSCSWPSCMLMKCFVARRATKSFVASAPNNTKPSLGTKLKRSFALVAAMIKAHPCLKSDFQVFMRNDGAVLNIDLDRCYHYSLSATQKKRTLAHKRITLTTRPLRLNCRTNVSYMN